ncbi:MAG: dihydroneopterin aldolase [Armatimonadota bacterium]
MPTFTVTVSGLEFYGHHGVTPAEREIGHWFGLDLALEVVGDAPLTDALEDTVDYGAVAHLAHQVGTSTSYKLVERLAQHIGEAILGEFARVQAVEIELAKLAPPGSVPVPRTGVRLRLARAVE